MATNTKQPPPPQHTNGVITAPVGNRKKQKRRQKQAMKAAAQSPMPHPDDEDQQPDVGYDEDALGFEEDDDEDYESEHYDDMAQQPLPPANGLHPPPLSKSKKKNKKKRAAGGVGDMHGHYDPGMLPPLPPTGALSPSGMRPPVRGGPSHENIWNVSSAQERQNIKEFWLSLSEEERKSLLKIEKEAVLKKMKQQQKHSCSCTVCGRKRTAIEEELEVLYEGYYEELEQYAHHDHPPLPNADGMMPDPLQHRRQHPLAFHPPSPPPMPHHKTSHLHEHLDDDEEYSEDEEEEYSDEDEEDEDDYSDEEPEPEPLPPHGRPPVQDFFSFGSQLTVKGILTPWVEKLKAGLKGNADNLLTVADDLLKNDGRKFIEMMEQLAERRMQRENRSHYDSEHHAGYPPNDTYDQEDPLAAGDDYDDDEASYDSQDEYDDEMDEEDEMGGLTEEQRMQEGRRMFQIFAARMFEQRVLQAYKEKVAEERQAKLLAELDDEKSLQAQREAKKQRDAQKKKEKKKQQQQVKAEEKAKRDAEKAAEEAKLREAEAKKLEEQRRKKEEQRRKREEEKKKQEEEKARKEQEKQRRLLEEQQRREEAERKAREAKAAEKARKEETRKREREEREAREKEARDRKAQEEKERKEREAKAKADKEAKEREKSAQQGAHPPQHHNPPQITKRPSQPGMVAVPGVYPKQTHSGISSPHLQIATPAIPKAPTPAKQRHASHQASQASSPKQAQSQLSSAPSKSSSPGSIGQQQASSQPKTILQKSGNQQPGGQQNQNPMPTPSPLHQHPMQPPPGMPHPQHHPAPFGGIPHMGFPGFPGSQGPFAPNGMQRGPMPMFNPQQGPPPIGMQTRMSFPGMNGMPPPPGMMHPPGRGFPSFEAGAAPPPGFGQPMPQQNNHVSPIGQSPGGLSNGPGMPGHSRQLSSDKERFESAANQPIGRPPAPIQRPTSVKPGPERNGSGSDVEDLSKHLGSSALLDDADEPLPTNAADNRRHSNLAPGARNISIPGGGLGNLGGFGPPGGAFGTPTSTWGTPAMPFGSSPGLGQPGWGSLPNQGMNSWGHSTNAFGMNGLGPMGPGPIHRGAAPVSRPLTIRQNVCNACKQLTMANRDQGDGFHDVQILLRQIEANRPMLDSPPSLKEIEEICETEGDAQNGGGMLHVRQNEGGEGFAVKWEPDAATPDQGRGHGGLGEIGSPLPGKILPATSGGHFGFGAPGMGRTSHLQPLGPPRAD